MEAHEKPNPQANLVALAVKWLNAPYIKLINEIFDLKYKSKKETKISLFFFFLHSLSSIQ